MNRSAIGQAIDLPDFDARLTDILQFVVQAFQCRGVSSTLVNGHLLWHAVEVNGLFEKVHSRQVRLNYDGWAIIAGWKNLARFAAEPLGSAKTSSSFRGFAPPPDAAIGGAAEVRVSCNKVIRNFISNFETVNENHEKAR